MSTLDELRLTAVCTDRGQHELAVLGEIDLLTDGRLLASDELRRAGVDADDIETAVKAIPHLREPDPPYNDRGEPNFEHSTCRYDHVHDRVIFRCPRCGRNPQPRGEWVRTVIRAFNESDDVTRIAEVPALDISTREVAATW